MRSVRIFNNSAVSVIMPDGRDAILLGKGIGFNKRPGDEINEGLIEKVYYVQTEMQAKFLQMLDEVRPDVMDAAEEIVAMAEKEGLHLSNQATISLIDHIGFAIERHEKGMDLPNLLLDETQLLYQKEYALGLRSLQIIRDHCKVELSEDEAGYIALHLVSNSVNKNAAYDILKFVNGALDILKETYGIALSKDSMDTQRLITHLKFLAQRILKNAEWDSDDGVDEMYEILLHRNEKNPLFLDRMEKYVEDMFHYKLSRQERFYLLVHLTKIL